MKRLLITICGRAGSKGFKNKNLKNFCGKPLVYYSLSAAELFIKKQWQSRKLRENVKLRSTKSSQRPYRSQRERLD